MLNFTFVFITVLLAMLLNDKLIMVLGKYVTRAEWRIVVFCSVILSALSALLIIKVLL